MARIHELFARQNSFKAKLRGRFLRYGLLIGQNLIKAGFYIQRESMKIVPILTGNLRASAFTRFTGVGLQTRVQVGYTAAYAIFVHEIVEYAHGSEFNAKHRDKIARLNYTTKEEVQGPLKPGQKKRKTKTVKVEHPYYFNRGVRQQSKFLSFIVSAHYYEIIAILERGVGK
jgi:hypothetical protein